MGVMWSKVTWLITRPRALMRAWRKLGFLTTMRLVAIRMGSGRHSIHAVRIPGYRFPILIRGGQSTDAWALYELLARQEYALVGDLDSPHFIVDAGANIGIASVYFLHQYPEARIVAVEPDPDNFELLRRNLAPYGDQVTLLQGAVWSRHGRLQLDFSVQQEWRISVRSPEGGQPGSVEAYTMPEVIAAGGGGNVDLLKMDIEGSESEVFGPQAPEWLPLVRNIAIELHNRQCVDTFFGALEGYQFDKLSHHKDNVVICRNLRAPAGDRSSAAGLR